MSRPLPRALALASLVLAAGSAETRSAPLITEFMAANESTLYDEDGNSSDWIELHNPDATPVNLGGYFLTDDPGELTGWRLPEVSLPAGGYLIVFASNKDRDVGELHTDFRLGDDAGGYLALVDPDGQTVVSEFVSYPEQFEDFSYGRAQSGGTTTEVLVREGDACKVLVPQADIGGSWRNLDFDDAGWSDATTGIGYERNSGYDNLIGPGGDVEAQTYGINSTAYFRVPFTVASLDGLGQLTFRMKYDDGFIAYLNGTEIASGNRPASPAWNSDASGDHPDGQATTFVDTDISGHIGTLLTEGNNLLAIHAMNGDTTSSDLLALPRLEGEFVSDPGELGQEGYFQSASPGQANGIDQGLPAGDVTISQPGRGFTGSLTVTLSTPSAGAQIRYTTNGDVPGGSSTLYSGGAITINSTTLLRARAFEAGLAPGAVAEEGYIRLASSAQSFSSDLPVVVMERFGGGPTAANGKAFTFFAFFEPDPTTGVTILNKPYALGTRGGFKTRGSSSSGFPKKAYSIEAWNEFNRNKDISPFGMPEESDWILNARSEFDRSLMRNAFIYELSNQVGRYAVRTQFVELFKDDNGGDLQFGFTTSQDYDGVYTFMEKISRDPERVDVERLPQSVSEEPGIAGGYMLKIDRPDPGDSGFSAGGQTVRWVYPKEEDATGAQATWIRDYLNAMGSSLSGPDYPDYIDVDSWVDHHLLNVLAINADALRLSTYFHKTRAGKLEFGPIWDFDRSMESTDGRDNNPSTWSGGTSYFTYPWWGALFEDENFWQVYIDRYFELRDGAFRTSNVHAIIDGMAAELNQAQVRNFQRFSDDLPRFGGYQGEVNHLKNWLATRLDWMDGQFAPRPNASRESGIYPAGTTLVLDAPLGGNQKIYYTLDGSDPRPDSERTTVIGTDLFGESQPVRALVPGSDIGTSWRTDLNYDDSAWLSGTNGVGYERSSGYTGFINIDVNTQMASNSSCYIRIKFDVDAADLEGKNVLSLLMRYDDGFVAYLNGTQIVADRAPAPVAWNSSATQTHDDGPAVIFQEFQVNTFLDLLQPGENLLAIHALNESTGSSDFLNQSKLVIGFDEGGGEGGTMGIEYTGPIVLDETARLFARVFDSDGGHSTSSGQTPVGTGWSAPLRAEYLVGELPASSSNLAVTEIMHDAYDLGDLLQGDGAFEWVELTNTSAGAISLTGVKFTEGISFDLPSMSLGAGDSIVVASDPAAFAQVYGDERAQLVVGSYDGALSDDGEELELCAADGSTIQSLNFPAGVASGGRSLVADVGGWRASRSVLGSPGAAEPTVAQVPDVFVNEILSNSPVPQVDMVELWNPGGALVDVSGWFLTDDLSQPEKFQLPAGSEIPAGGYLVFDENDFASFAFDSFGEEVFLIAAEPGGARLDYVDGFDFGDASAGVSFGRHRTSVGEVHYVPLAGASFGGANGQPVSGPLLITEVHYHPADAGGVEFVEIQNVGGVPVELAGGELSGSGFVFEAGAGSLAPGGILLLVDEDPAAFRTAFGIPGSVAIHGPLPGALNNGGERLRVRVPESTGVIGEPELLVSIDFADYSDDAPWPSSADGGGDSLHRLSPAGYGGDPVSWVAASPSPGVVESSPADWRAAFFTESELADPAVSGIFADADGDRLANVLEYLLGSDLRDGASAAALQISVVEEGGASHLEVEFTLRDGVTEYAAALEFASDLDDWSAADALLELIGTSPNGDGTTTQTYRSKQPIDALGTGEMFVRVRAVGL